MNEKNKRYQRLSNTIRELANHIDWLSPFLTKKALESGNVAGLKLNAEMAALEARNLLNFYEVEDKINAQALAEKE